MNVRTEVTTVHKDALIRPEVTSVAADLASSCCQTAGHVKVSLRHALRHT